MCSISVDDSRMYPAVRSAKLGSNAYFICDSITLATWSHLDYDNHSMPTNAHRYTPSVLMIYRIELYNIGVYECKGTTENYGQFYARGTLKIIGMLQQHVRNICPNIKNIKRLTLTELAIIFTAKNVVLYLDELKGP